MRFFNTAGPIKPELHYCLPPLERWNLDEILSLIDQQKYFVLHAPRQTGKTSCLLALVKYLNERNDYRALYANVEVGRQVADDISHAFLAGERETVDVRASDQHCAGAEGQRLC